MTPKTCPRCHKKHDSIPAHAKHFIDPDVGGYYWECDCGTTMFIPESEVDKNDAHAA